MGLSYATSADTPRLETRVHRRRGSIRIQQPARHICTLCTPSRRHLDARMPRDALLAWTDATRFVGTRSPTEPTSASSPEMTSACCTARLSAVLALLSVATHSRISSACQL